MDELRKLMITRDPGDSEGGSGPSSDGSSAGDGEGSYDSGSYEG